MVLPDVFCIFNRARGTEMVSPDDLLVWHAASSQPPSIISQHACELFGQLGLHLRLRKFPSGVLVCERVSFRAS